MPHSYASSFARLNLDGPAYEDTRDENTAKATATAPRTRIGTYSFTLASLLARPSRRRLWARLCCNRMGIR